MNITGTRRGVDVVIELTGNDLRVINAATSESLFSQPLRAVPSLQLKGDTLAWGSDVIVLHPGQEDVANQIIDAWIRQQRASKSISQPSATYPSALQAGHLSTPTASQRRTSTGVIVGLWICGAASLISWAYTASRAKQLDNDLDEIAESFFIDASAVQISQLADQSMLELAGPFITSCALSMAFIVGVGLTLARTR